MKTYIVSSSGEALETLKTSFNGSGLGKAARIQAIKAIHEDFLRIVKEFAAQHPGQIIVGESAWINQTVKIEATDAIVKKLRKVAGIGDISAPRPITFDALPPKQQRPQA